MKWLQKITALVMIPFILLSLSGSSIHLHYCGHEDRLYADVHLASLSLNSDHQCAAHAHAAAVTHDQHSHNAASCCAPDTACANEAPAHDECCVDVEQPVVTDDNYKSSNFNLKIEITEIHLLEDHSFFHVDSRSLEPIYIPIDQNLADSPDLTRLGILLL